MEINGSGEGSADEEGSGLSVQDKDVDQFSPICLDKRINVNVKRNQDQIEVSYRAFRFRTTKQGTRDIIDVGIGVVQL